MNNKVLIVGSFPLKNSNVYGGIAKSCKILINSALALNLVNSNKTLDECYEESKENIFNGNALKKLIQLREITNKN